MDIDACVLFRIPFIDIGLPRTDKFLAPNVECAHAG